MNLQTESGVLVGRVPRIVTRRLEIAPLTRDEAHLYLTDVAKYAQKLGLSETPCEPDPDTRDALNWLIDVGLSYDSDSIAYAAIWAIVERSTRRLVGNASFKGAPINGDAEIGYGTDEPYRGQGFMTEAVRAFVDWGRTRPELKGIIAETLKNNPASQRVLKNAGFELYPEKKGEEDSFFWRVDVSSSPY
ncbi:MAG: GNAT family N-acetyltransferase [Thermoguttaceae bacterium]|nr:GNAT family N-acetyltransferase [Thermoguttaceae bacterium]